MTSRDRSQLDEDALAIEERFAIVPEWMLDAAVSDCAVRLYCALLRYGNSSGARMPSRTTLAARLRKRSTDTVDRAMRELVDLGAVEVHPRYSGRERLTNRYLVRTSRPAQDAVPAEGSEPQPTPGSGGSRKFAATGNSAARGGRTDPVTPAADLRPNREFSTESITPPPAAGHRPSMAEECGIEDWDGFARECAARRSAVRRPSARWSAPCLDAALQLAVHARGWPAELAARALLIVAADAESRSPMRLAEAGPWWDLAEPRLDEEATAAEVQRAELLLGEVGGLRVVLQKRSRSQLAAEGRPVTRSTVALRALTLLEAMNDPVAV